ncbi:MAG: hypothetical protein IPL27_23040 [Lewinellaceae bacterium]|nr:hypothetical protein [Lewinellaceae bacterium]
MTVPGPNGEQAPITFNYSGGIRMDEQASWLGLGWGYEPGEISHYPRGVSDDWNGKRITTITSNSAQVLWIFSGVLPTLTNQVTEDSYFFGPLYFKNDRDYTKRENKMDVATSEYKLPAGAGFSFPDYDTYHVSGPGIGGSMSPKIYAWGGYHIGDQSREDPYIHYPVYTFDGSKQVHFYFDDDINQHNIAQVLGTYWGANNTSSSPLQYDPSTNRINTGTYVEYFTNTVINAGSAGFKDYRITTGIKRPAAEFDPDGIGAFRITTPEGRVYHYSLPVYMLENEKITSFFLDNTFNLDNTEDKKEIIKRNRYAVSWKLTAVTGVDYVDANNNGIVDTGDTGYWIAYNYGKWTNDFRWKTPFFNYNPNQYNKREPSNYRYPDYQLQQYKREGTVSTGQMQVYYLKSIQTATHSALFIKEIRLDAHAEKEATNTITPLLRLSRIVLVRNENLFLFSNTASLPYDSRFSMAKCNPSNVTPHIGNINSNETPIKAATLEAVELTGDYGLCKMLHNNINNTFTTTSVIYSNNFNTEIYRKFDEGAAASTSDAANSGKLTLKEVKLFGLNYKATAPSYVFDYAQSNASKNPNFNPFRSDYWGYYKSDFNFQFRGRYTTEGTMSNPGSKNNVDVWSLKKITTPLGGEILIDYESDVYEKVSDGKGYVSPKRYFLIKSAVLPGTGWQPNAGIVSVSKDIDDFLALPGIQFKEAFLPFKTGFVGNNCTAIARAYNSAPSNILNGQALTLTPRNSTADTREVELNIMYANISSSIGCGTYNPVYSPKFPGWGYIALRTSFASRGGVRVKQISIKDPDNNLSYTNEYTYENGAAGSEPTDITALIEAHTIGKSNYANDPCMPPAVVMYGKVTVRSKSLQNTYNGKSEYRFDNMYDRSVSYRQIGPEPPDTNALIPCSTAKIETFTTVWECIGALGRPLSVTHFDNNDNIVSSELYEYYPGSPDASPSLTETFIHQLKRRRRAPLQPALYSAGFTAQYEF